MGNATFLEDDLFPDISPYPVTKGIEVQPNNTRDLTKSCIRSIALTSCSNLVCKSYRFCSKCFKVLGFSDHIEALSDIEYADGISIRKE